MNYLQFKVIPSSVDGRIAKLWLNVIRQVGLMTMYLREAYSILWKRRSLVVSPMGDVASPMWDLANPTLDVAGPIRDVASPTWDVASPMQDISSPTIAS